ncbi:DeoR/GlpR transcriptional regulator [Tessaracoccus sp. HDW20]|uniref:DeoR/GlpR family DNA-binding transcription regulator n=1 Tax=Tessaracoccus coleopterorum TaxID=2714950 RepID=UPI0018D431C0|nr:DeoR/GlpR family DNA-binding transcription regulator [Tessaracoccus coleopterorum]NHB85110.1 DeoR/GlpR transcriptional regulator [Tessaracoccus coleopterorum]
MTLKKRGQTLGWERRQEILKFLRANGSASVSVIGDHVSASPATIHRDLELLAEQKVIERVHGGALAVESLDDPPVATERLKRVAEKEMIAQEALTRITPRVSSIFLEASTTVSHLVPKLRTMSDKVFVTNSRRSPWRWRSAMPRSCSSGQSAIEHPRRGRAARRPGPTVGEHQPRIHRVERPGCAGVTTMNSVEAETKAAVINATATVIALGDGGKLGRRALVPVAPLSALTELITDADAPQEEVDALRAAG